jgi:uncharacterized protein YraI
MRFRKSIKVARGVRLNLSKSGLSTSLGGRGARVNFGPRGVTTTASIPGTGISQSTLWGSRRKAIQPSPQNSKDTGRANGWGCGCLCVLGLLFLIGMCASDPEIEGEEAETAAAQSLVDPNLAANNHENTTEEQSVVPKPASDVVDLEEERYVTASNLNARSDPSGSSRIIKKLPYRSRIKVTGQKGDWLRVLDNGLTYWVAASYASRTRPRLRPQYRPRRNYSGSHCPCSGSRVCIGPRGGRYCITSGGNKRYGV